jgi:hypothetical protein
MTRVQRIALLCTLLTVPGGFVGWNVLLFFSSEEGKQVAPIEERIPPPGYREYKSGRFGLSLFYPENYKVSKIRSSAITYNILFEDEAGGGGFEIFIVYYLEDRISQERFLMDIPSGIRRDEEKIYLDGVEAVRFLSEDAELGVTREVWFIHRNYLFELVSVQVFDPWMDDIIKSIDLY